MPFESRYAFDTTNINYINAIKKYNRRRRILTANQIDVSTKKKLCAQLNEIIELSAQLDEIVHGAFSNQIEITCSSSFAASLENILPRAEQVLSQSVVAEAQNKLDAAQIQVAKEEAAKVANEVIYHWGRLFGGYSLNKFPPKLEKLSLDQAILLMSELQTQFNQDDKAKLNGIMHLAEYGIILFYINYQRQHENGNIYHEGYAAALDYANGKRLYDLRDNLGFDIDDGFVKGWILKEGSRHDNSEIEPDIINLIVDELNANYFAPWQANNYAGPIIQNVHAGLGNPAQYLPDLDLQDAAAPAIPALPATAPVPIAPKKWEIYQFSGLVQQYIKTETRQLNTLIAELNLSEEEKEKFASNLEELTDPVTLEYIKLPVTLNERFYDFDTIKSLDKDPLSQTNFDAKNVQTGRNAFKDFETLKEQVRQHRLQHSNVKVATVGMFASTTTSSSSEHSSQANSFSPK